MISVEKAKELVTSTTGRLAPVCQSVLKCLHQVLAEDVVSHIAYPPFNQSSMDGFAILHSDYLEQKEIELKGEAPAGKPFNRKISFGQAVRVFTGSKIPEGADTVVMQENVSVENGKLIIREPTLTYLANVRIKGSHITEGTVALKSGTVLNPAAIGFLTGLGVTSVSIFPKPKVSILITGNELQAPGTLLSDGQVYESNSFALQSALESINIVSVETFRVLDDEKLTAETLQKAITGSDMVLVSGGISVGKYDYVANAMQQLGVQSIFYKVLQKPGKPLFFGKQNNCLLFSLPGNPAAALTCFYEYVYPALRIMQGYSDIFLKQVTLPVLCDFNKKAGLSFFLKGRIINGSVEILEGQESNNIGSFALADCLIYVPTEKTFLHSRETVEVHLLP